MQVAHFFACLQYKSFEAAAEIMMQFLSPPVEEGQSVKGTEYHILKHEALTRFLRWSGLS